MKKKLEDVGILRQDTDSDGQISQKAWTCFLGILCPESQAWSSIFTWEICPSESVSCLKIPTSSNFFFISQLSAEFWFWNVLKCSMTSLWAGQLKGAALRLVFSWSALGWSAASWKVLGLICLISP